MAIEPRPSVSMPGGVTSVSQSSFCNDRRQFEKPKPEEAPKCKVCSVDFGFFSPRHHCDSCGASLCSAHIQDCEVDIPKYNARKKNIKACETCVNLIKEETAKKDVNPDTLTSDAQWKDNICTQPTDEMRIILTQEGMGRRKPVTVMQAFSKAVANRGDKVALKREKPDGTWEGITWKQYYDMTMQCARAFVKLGVQHFGSVNIVGFNSTEWFVSNMASIAVGAKSAGTYTTNNPEACAYVAGHCSAAVAVIEDQSQLSKFLKVRDTLPDLKAIVMWKGKVPADANVDGKCPVYTWDEMMSFGVEEKGGLLHKEVEKRMAVQKPGHCCTLIYTSGTTGPPKAAMLCHDNLTYTARAMLAYMPDYGRVKGRAERMVSYLPLSHVAAQVLDLQYPMVVAGAFNNDVEVWFARPDALKGTINQTLLACRPTLFFGVPRVWEKFMEAVQRVGAKNGFAKKMIGNWAKAIGLAKYENGQVGGSGAVDPLFNMANGMVHKKVQGALGLDQCRYNYTGAAPTNPAVINYFAQFDIQLYEAYGISEGSGPQNITTAEFYATGSTGQSLPGMNLVIDKPEGEESGEMLFRGRNRFMGYLNDMEKTKAAIDERGYMHSGDIGRVDKYGMLYITGRLKEIIITAGGENIAPVPIEDSAKTHMPAISNIMMVGDKRKFNTCLICLHQQPEGAAWKSELAGASLSVGTAKTAEEARTDPAWIKYIEDGLAKTNNEVVSRAAKIQKFYICPFDFSVPEGDLTPTLKLKRSVVEKKHSKAIEAMYA